MISREEYKSMNCGTCKHWQPVTKEKTALGYIFTEGTCHRNAPSGVKEAPLFPFMYLPVNKDGKFDKDKRIDCYCSQWERGEQIMGKLLTEEDISQYI